MYILALFLKKIKRYIEKSLNSAIYAHNFKKMSKAFSGRVINIIFIALTSPFHNVFVC